MLASEGGNGSLIDIAQGLIAEGASPRFAALSPEGQAQVAKVVVLAESNPALLKARADPETAAEQLPFLHAPMGLQLEQLIGSLVPESLIVGLAGIVVTVLVAIATHWIAEAYRAQGSWTSTVA